MKPGKKIMALLMLLIMFFMMMHNAVPHVHHHGMNGVTGAIVSGHHHEHHGNGHHSDGQDNSEDRNSFLDLLFKKHSHSKHLHQSTPDSIKQVKPAKHLVKVFFFPDKVTILDFTPIDTGLRYFPLQDLTPDQPCPLSTPLRGPPSLG